jgi:hypothetical protein
MKISVPDQKAVGPTILVKNGKEINFRGAK